MAGRGAFAFADPQAYQAAVRPAQIEVFVTAKGNFHAELTRVELPRLWLQRGHESLPRIIRSTVSAERPPIFFLASEQVAVHHSGMEVSFGEILSVPAGSSHYHRSWASSYWATISLAREDLAAAGYALVGEDLTAPTTTRRLRPAPPLMVRLLKLHAAAGQLAEAAPQVLTQPEVARSLEQALVHAMIRCLTDDTAIEMDVRTRRHGAVVARLEEFLAENQDRPLHLADICAATGVLERTLRRCCQEHLGMGPLRYLWLRRMHLARRALASAAPETTTVAAIAMDYGFWELGRFSVQYTTLFGESPSASLRRQPGGWQTLQTRPLALPMSETA
jgi:AraC-like DNA-binding protein